MKKVVFEIRAEALISEKKYKKLEKEIKKSMDKFLNELKEDKEWKKAFVSIELDDREIDGSFQK